MAGRKFVAKIETNSAEKRDAIELIGDSDPFKRLTNLAADPRVSAETIDAILARIDDAVQDGLLDALSANQASDDVDDELEE